MEDKACIKITTIDPWVIDGRLLVETASLLVPSWFLLAHINKGTELMLMRHPGNLNQVPSEKIGNGDRILPST